MIYPEILCCVQNDSYVRGTDLINAPWATPHPPQAVPLPLEGKAFFGRALQTVPYGISPQAHKKATRLSGFYFYSAFLNLLAGTPQRGHFSGGFSPKCS